MKIVTRLVLPAAVILIAFVCAGALFAMRGSAERVPPDEVVTKVEVVELQASSPDAIVRATGVVEAARKVTIMPEVSGRIVSQSKNLVPGGRVTEGEVLARIDARDYSLAADQAAAQVKQAELELRLEEGRAEVAKREWALLHGDRDASEAPLALRGPQLATAKQSLESAKAAWQRAQISTGRTTLKAPFNALVSTENVDVGQVVGPSSQVATLIGTDAFWVKVSVPVQWLGQIDVRGLTSEQGSMASVTQRLGKKGVERTGEVVQLMAELDAQTRTAQLLVEIKDPLQSSGLPLLPGAYVDVVIEGNKVDGALSLPRTALRNSDEVWIVKEGVLARRTVRVAWTDNEFVVVDEGLEPGDQVITSPLSTPIEGRKVEILDSLGTN